MSELRKPTFVARLAKTFLAQPVYRLIVITLVVVTAVPLGFIGTLLYQQAWDNAWREISEKHRLLAENLASPIKIYINDHSNMLELLAESIRNNPESINQQQQVLDNVLHHMKGFRSLALVGKDGQLYSLAQSGDINQSDAFSFSTEQCFLTTRSSLKGEVSNIKRSVITGQPTIIISAAVLNKEGQLDAVLLGELQIDVIEKLRKNIRFGKAGHSAIVDRKGHVVAHPNPEWMKEMRDLSKLGIVQKMMRGETGVTEFYSPFIKENMVAGYTAVPEIGWGIMVPQPKSEVEEQVYKFLYAHLKWGTIGLLLALVIAIPLVIWITRPIKQLAIAANRLVENSAEGEIPDVAKNAPREIGQLGTSLRKLVSNLQESSKTISDLNQSLQTRVDEATEKLRSTNAQLISLSQQDHLTELANRRHFESVLSNILEEPTTVMSQRCLMVFDLDNFKQINDQFGHAAGDEVLLRLSKLLKSYMRPSDIVARFGGDEFVAQAECNPEVARRRAEEILRTVEAIDIDWHGDSVKVTVSIGLLHWKQTGNINMVRLLHKADQAMYEAKARGRNQLVEVFDNQDG